MKDGIEFRFRHHFGDFRLDAEAVIPSRGVSALFGRSGSGKTSLLRCIAGLETARDAFLSVAGQVWQDGGRGIFLPAHKRPVGYVFQDGALFPHMRVRANLEYGHKRTPPGRQQESFERVVQVLGLGPLLNRYPGGLSGGEQQRVAIGRALLNHPQLLLMDEPLAGLDRERKKEILPYLERLHTEAQIPIVYVTHDLDELVRIADHLVLVEDGSLIASGSLESLLSRLDLPIVRDDDAGAVIDTRILAHDDHYQLTELGFAGGKLTVGRIGRVEGSGIRIRIHARDVSLALEAPGPTSILNILQAEVREMAEHGEGRIMVRLETGGVPLLARITRKSREHLDLQPGMAVYAQIKSVALSL